MQDTDAPDVPNHVPNGSEPQAVTLAEAARLAGVSERAIRARVERGTLPTSRAVRGGRVVALVELHALAVAYPQIQAAPQLIKPEPEPPDIQRATVELQRVEADEDRAQELELRAQLAAAREEVARLSGMLALSEKVEQSAQRYADKLEAKLEAVQAKLDTSTRDALTLAHQLGRVQGVHARTAEQLEAASRPWWRRLLRR